MKTFRQFLKEVIKPIEKMRVLKNKGFVAKGFVPTKDNEKKSGN